MREYREFSYAGAVSDFLSTLDVGEEKVFTVECPRRGRELPIRLARPTLSHVAAEMGIRITCHYERDIDVFLVKRLR